MLLFAFARMFTVYKKRPAKCVAILQRKQHPIFALNSLMKPTGSSLEVHAQKYSTYFLQSLWIIKLMFPQNVTQFFAAFDFTKKWPFFTQIIDIISIDIKTSSLNLILFFLLLNSSEIRSFCFVTNLRFPKGGSAHRDNTMTQ